MKEPKKYFTIIDHGDKVEFMCKVGKEEFKTCAVYEKDKRGFMPATFVNKLIELSNLGYKQVQ